MVISYLIILDQMHVHLFILAFTIMLTLLHQFDRTVKGVNQVLFLPLVINRFTRYRRYREHDDFWNIPKFTIIPSRIRWNRYHLKKSFCSPDRVRLCLSVSLPVCLSVCLLRRERNRERENFSRTWRYTGYTAVIYVSFLYLLTKNPDLR